jgi:hypothetical protein
MFVTERRCFLAPLCLLCYSWNKTKLLETGLDVHIAVVMKNSVFLDIMLFNPLKANGGLGRTCPLHLHAAILLALFFDPEDGADMFFRKVGWLPTNYTVLYPRRQNT